MRNLILTGIGTGLIGAILGYVFRKIYGQYMAEGMEQKARAMIADSKREVETSRKESEIRAKAELVAMKESFEHDVKDRRKEVQAQEKRLAEREQNLDRRINMIEKRENRVDTKAASVEEREAETRAREAELEGLVAAETEELQRISGMTPEVARQQILHRVESEVSKETATLIRRLQEQARESAKQEAQRIIVQAIERYAGASSSEVMTCTVALASADMKGRIIGRDGRNIRALEAATGCDIMIDDTTQTVVLSCFDPVRRELGRQVIDRLLVDGRIHPARIEEVVVKVEEEMEETIRTAGEETIYRVGVEGASPEVVRMLGRLKFRRSFSQNLLEHSTEVAFLAGMMASELGLDAALARRVGLFHDIGKAMDHEIEGGHAIIGAELLRRNGEDQVVVNAIAAHHDEVEAQSVYALLASAGDAISAARPGARSDRSDLYIKRLEKLEEIASSRDGVEKCYAVQAGREIRVMVSPQRITDAESLNLAREISRQIEEQVHYPGVVKVVVIREMRCIEYAR